MFVYITLLGSFSGEFSSQVDTLMSKAQLNWYYYIKFTTWQVGRDGSKAEVIISTVNGYDYVPAIVLLTDKETATDVLEQVVNINSSFLCSA